MARARDYKSEMKAHFHPPVGTFVDIDVPELRFVMVDGAGNPNTTPAYREALAWLYSVSYAMKFASRAKLDRDYVVPPLEGLWWADDPADFVLRNKDAWTWTMMIMVPDFITPQIFAAALERTAQQRGTPPRTFRFATLCEGPCLQTMHVGRYDDEGPTLARLHDVIMPARKLTFNGPHHEIYIGDPRRAAPERLRTVLRQPVRPVAT